MITNSKSLSVALLTVLFSAVLGALVYMSSLVKDLAQEEQKNMQIWADATQQLILADENDDIDFYTTIIEKNTTIPVYMVDESGQVLLTRNVSRPTKDISSLHGPIEVVISEEIRQFIYYDDSYALKRLRYFPFIALTLILAFVAIAIMVLLWSERSEKNRLWAGLSKETAHQLGTPISSLNGWQMLLSERYPEDELIPQMGQDIKRLGNIADRFSKVGSVPTLEEHDMVQVVNEVVEYMRARVSKRIVLSGPSTDTSPQGEENRLEGQEKMMVEMNVPLFSWVLENLIKNAVDAIEGEGEIVINLKEKDKQLIVDVSDNGRGIDKRNQRKIFRMGYTTKQRGWGLGLSLAKRIVEDYHRGKLELKSSEVGKGTTFRIVLGKG